MANKIKYGLKNVYYAKATIADDGSATYGEPVRFPGAVSLSMEPQGDSTQFYADNIVYYSGYANSGYEGDLEVARVIEEFEKDILGAVADKSGVLVEKANPEAVHFALLFQFEGDKNATRHVFYNCTASRPSVESETKSETVEPQTETLSLTVGSIYNASFEDDIVKAKVEYTEGTTTPYQKWFTTVYIPEKASA